MSGRQDVSARSLGAVDEQAARRLSRLLRAGRVESVAALAAGISHDLNNVLAAVLLTADVLAPHVRAPAAERALAALDELARQGIGIARQVLFLARGIDGQPAPFDLRHLIAEVRTLARGIVPPPATVLTSYPADLRLVASDPVLVYQLLLEACREARRAHRELGTLRIRARNAVPDGTQPGVASPVPPGPHVLVEVIAEDAAGGKPVRPRRRAGTSGRAWPKGALRQALERGGARFGSGSTNRGRVVLLVHLPAVLEAGPEESHPEVPLSPGRGELVLVVEEEAMLRELLVGSLEGHGYRVVSSDGGPEAAGLMAMPDVQVAVVAQPADPAPGRSPALLDVARSRAIPIVTLTGAAAPVAGAPPADTGQVLSKPFTAAELLSKVDRALRAAAVAQGARPS